MRIGYTFERFDDFTVAPGDQKDRYSEFDSEPTVRRQCQAIERAGHTVVRIGGFTQLLERRDEVKRTIDLVFNLSEGFEGRNRESQVPMLLEQMGVPYTGSDALTMGITLDKVMTKKCLIADGIPTPAYITTDKVVTSLTHTGLSFPLIVKPRWEGSSKGISSKSKVKSLDELNKQIAFIRKEYQQPALIEAFVAGREFTVAILGNGSEAKVFGLVEVQLHGKAAAGNIFTSRYAYVTGARYDGHPKISYKMKKYLSDIALNVYQSVNCRDIGRVDIRTNENSEPFVLEINPIPALSRQDVFGILAKQKGIKYDTMIKKILDVAKARYRLK